MSRRACAAIFALMTFAAHANAQEGSDAREEARGRFERGLALFQDNALDAALAEFRRSIALYPTRAAAQNIAVTLRRLKRFDEAEAAFQALERDYPDLSSAERATIARDLAEIAPRVGEVLVRASEPGATVVIDGLERGRAPLAAPLRLSSGTHVVRVSKPGFAAFEARVEVVGRGTTTVDARLSALEKAGRLTVAAEKNERARVVVDDVIVGVAPWEGTLSVGRHTVALRGEGTLGSPPAAAEIRADQLTKLSLLLEPLECRIRIEPTPATGFVAVDGVEVGRGIWQGDLRCGGHFIEIGEEGFVATRKSVALTKDHAVTVRESLERDPESDAFKKKNPPRVTVDGRALFLVGPSLGGALADGCTGDCSSSLSLGGGAMLRGGYKLGIGLGFTLDAGFIAVSQSFTQRPAEASVPGLPSHAGAADDELSVRGPLLGGSASSQIGKALVWMGRLGAGVMFAAWRDERTGTFRTAPEAPPYATPRLGEDGSVIGYYVNPEVRAGVPFGNGWTFDFGVQGFLLLGLSKARWEDSREFNAGQCPNADPGVCGGRGSFGASAILGTTVFLASPFIGVRHEL